MNLHAHTTAVRAEGRKGLVAFLTAGYPDEATFLEVAVAAGEAGCDVIEIGIPFSDPIADGPVIQAASSEALAKGMTLRRAIDLAGTLSQKVDAAIVIMSYINPILALGLERFARAASAAGVAGIIIPDVPIEESEPSRAALRAAGIAHVDLLAPTSSDERVARISKNAEGFLYLVSRTGVTGARSALASDLGAFVDRVRPHTDVPLYVGFGVSTPEQAAIVARMSDGVIIGSRLIKAIGNSAERRRAAERVTEFLSRVRNAIDAV